MNPQFDELSRKAANATLGADERERLQAQLREHPELQADLEWDAAFHAKLQEKIAAMPALPGWERTERLLQDEPLPSAAAARPGRAGPAHRRGVLDRLAQWLESTLGVSMDAQAVAAVLVLAQAGVIGVLAWQYEARDHEATRAGVADATPRGPLLRVSFRQDVREAQMRRALADIGGEIVGGPGQLGVYMVRVAGGDLRTAAQRLRDSGTTELVEIVEPQR
jgi:hypothetical protein